MTDTGQVPGEGLPENAGMVEQPGVPAHGAYTYLSETPAEDEDLLLLPGAQGAWGNEVAPPVPEPVVETVHEPGPHETAGRDSGSHDLSAVRTPPQAPTIPIPPITPRRPLHLGPPLPDTSASPVRSLADRGPAGAPVRQPGPPTVGPEYLDVPQPLREMSPQGAAPWGAPAPVGTAAPAAETVVPVPEQGPEPVGAAQAAVARLATEAVAATAAPQLQEAPYADQVPGAESLPGAGVAYALDGVQVPGAGVLPGGEGLAGPEAGAGPEAATGPEPEAVPGDVPAGAAVPGVEGVPADVSLAGPEVAEVPQTGGAPGAEAGSGNAGVPGAEGVVPAGDPIVPATDEALVAGDVTVPQAGPVPGAESAPGDAGVPEAADPTAVADAPEQGDVPLATLMPDAGPVPPDAGAAAPGEEPLPGAVPQTVEGATVLPGEAPAPGDTDRTAGPVPGGDETGQPAGVADAAAQQVAVEPVVDAGQSADASHPVDGATDGTQPPTTAPGADAGQEAAAPTPGQTADTPDDTTQLPAPVEAPGVELGADQLPDAVQDPVAQPAPEAAEPGVASQGPEVSAPEAGQVADPTAVVADAAAPQAVPVSEEPGAEPGRMPEPADVVADAAAPHAMPLPEESGVEAGQMAQPVPVATGTTEPQPAQETTGPEAVHPAEPTAVAAGAVSDNPPPAEMGAPDAVPPAAAVAPGPVPPAEAAALVTALPPEAVVPDTAPPAEAAAPTPDPAEAPVPPLAPPAPEAVAPPVSVQADAEQPGPLADAQRVVQPQAPGADQAAPHPEAPMGETPEPAATPAEVALGADPAAHPADAQQEQPEQPIPAHAGTPDSAHQIVDPASQIPDAPAEATALQHALAPVAPGESFVAEPTGPQVLFVDQAPADRAAAPQLDQPVGQFVPVDGSVPTTPHLAPTPPQGLVLPEEEPPVVPAPRDGDPELVQQADDLDTRVADPEESTAAVAEARQSTGPAAPAYDDAEREAVLKVMRERRDIRNGFRSDPIPHEVLLRVLEAAHTAPSVGHSQPWDFVVIRSAETRAAMQDLAQRQREAYAKSLPKGRAKQFKELKIEAILETPVNIVVTADPTRGGRHTLGRHTQPQMAPYSAALAVENLWLAARAEGLGVGWVSFFDEREMVRALGLPEHLEVIAYLCVGYVDEFPDEPELMQAGWSKRRPLSWVVHEETYGRRALPGEEPHDLLAETVSQIRPLDAKALGEAWERQKRMTKPAGALGMLEIISAQLSGLSRQCPPPIPEPAAVAIFAGDHGVHAQGVTPWPQEVTAQMVANFLGGGAVCNAFAGQVGAEVCVVDVGVAADLPATPGLLPRKIRAGTSDMTTGPAMTREEAKQAIEVGIETARDLVAAGNKALLTGEMGIANTTASAALISVFTDTDPAEVTGRGTGINDETLARKTEVVRRAIEVHQPDPADPIGVLAAIGGFEHAAMVGLLLGGASLRTPVILDGVSAGAAALVARAIAPEVLAACIAGHRSAEPGHVAALNKLGLRPLVDLDLRLGEGTGALLALPLVQSTARAMHEVATFDSAGVTEK